MNHFFNTQMRCGDNHIPTTYLSVILTTVKGSVNIQKNLAWRQLTGWRVFLSLLTMQLPAPEKALKIADEVNDLAGRALAKGCGLEDCASLPGESYLAIQATNVGMFPKTEEAVIEDAAFYRKIRIGYDLVFNPARTRFMSLVRESGGRAFGGLKMLLYQGIIAYELWTGAEIDSELAGKAYGEMRKAMKIE